MDTTQNPLLYKYLDALGALNMIKHHDLQFTNATKLNDPFDCHPGLIDFSKVPEHRTKYWSKDDVIAVESNLYERIRDGTWLCSLSKVYDSLLMWSYYNGHKGVCLGLDMEKAKPYLSNIRGATMIGCDIVEVQYKEILDKPDYFRPDQSIFLYQWSTKAKEWAHEQEVRLVIDEPSQIMPWRVPNEFKDRESVDYKEIRFHPTIGPECFDSMYLGIKLEDYKKEQLIEAAKSINPTIKIYQMEIDPVAFKLKAKLL